MTREAIERFKTEALLAAIKAQEIKNLNAALEFALKITREKEKSPNLMPEVPDPAQGKKSLFFSGLDDERFEHYAQKALDEGFYVARDKCRSFCGGIDTAFSFGSLAIANGATIIMDLLTEDERLATMISQIHIIAIPNDRVVMDLKDAEDFLADSFARQQSYLSFISGSSRTSDIERVLTIGAHGPVELHVALLEEI
ncbi:MAG: lactate utilization protein [Deltaproteobacteria bacterium]|jgi:L-lactate dehydrogenase complex protein LldG|nr:lactate utilization protein [Deltaproteobacteria bacterium]